VRVFGIDPGSDRTGYGCVESDGRKHHLIACGAIRASASATFPDKLAGIHRELSARLAECQPDCVAIEDLFHAVNVRSALRLGHARGVAVLAAVEAGLTVVEYTPAEIKRAVVGYGRAEKPQVQQMVKLLLRLAAVPSPHDAADALAVAICHLHSGNARAKAQALEHLQQETRATCNQSAGAGLENGAEGPRFSRGTATVSSWRKYRPRA
jgi:crossover junction endodeoxyribonuclease RuvC